MAPEPKYQDMKAKLQACCIPASKLHRRYLSDLLLAILDSRIAPHILCWRIEEPRSQSGCGDQEKNYCFQQKLNLIIFNDEGFLSV
jgi:hypothetical protein